MIVELALVDIIGIVICSVFAGAIAGGLVTVRAYEKFGKFSKKEDD